MLDNLTMSSTHHALYYHFVFGTKEREPWIAPAWRDRLHAYMGGLVRAADGVPTVDRWNGGPRSPFDQPETDSPIVRSDA
ncbi:MAG: hypothetical protein WDN28_05745 [Chthoniobacter sp.]